jgi:proteasome lid subunit RPN8/RPN11
MLIPAAMQRPRLTLAADALVAMRARARRSLPAEACGLLLGDDGARRTIKASSRSPSVWARQGVPQTLAIERHILATLPTTPAFVA